MDRHFKIREISGKIRKSIGNDNVIVTKCIPGTQHACTYAYRTPIATKKKKKKMVVFCAHQPLIDLNRILVNSSLSYRNYTGSRFAEGAITSQRASPRSCFGILREDAWCMIFSLKGNGLQFFYLLLSLQASQKNFGLP